MFTLIILKQTYCDKLFSETAVTCDKQNAYSRNLYSALIITVYDSFSRSLKHNRCNSMFVP